MIVGIGVDIVQIPRIEESIKKFGNKFLSRNYSEEEIIQSEKYKNNKSRAGYFAKRFAAKEAFAKAIGTGISGGLEFKQISILNDDLGKPYIKISESTGKILPKFSKAHISLSDDYPIAIAEVLIEG